MSDRKIHWLSGISLLLSPVAFAAVRVTSIDFKNTSQLSEIRIQGEKPLEFVKSSKEKEKQIVIELQNAFISNKEAKKIDTSSFLTSKVSSISPSPVAGKKDSVQIVIQMKEAGTAEVIRNGNWLQIQVPTRSQKNSSTSTDVIRSSKAADTDALPAQTTQDPDSPAPSADPSAPASPGTATEAAPSDNTSSSTLNDAPLAQLKIDEFIENSKEKKFTGKPITLKVRDAAVTDVLKIIGEASGFNMVIADDVKGNLTLTLEDVPWDQAMDLVFRTMRLGAERNNNVLRIMTLKGLKEEKEEENRIAIASQAIVPFVTRVFPISYANLTDLQGVLNKALSNRSGASTGGTTEDPTKVAFVQADPRTNSLVVRDTLENMERMKKLIEILDSQTPQVMIEAKIIEASESFSKNLTGTLGGNQGGQSFAGFSGANPIDPLVGAPGVYADGAAVSGAAGATSAGVFGMSLDFLPGLSRLNALLTLGENENQLKVVASPKTVVLNKQKASITQGTPILVAGTTTVAGVGTVPTNQVQQAKISLEVTPTVTNDGSVMMALLVNKDVPVPLAGGTGGIGTRALQTDVLVDSGSTLVIGGVYTMSSSHTGAGFPILRKIPILGALFGNNSDSEDRSELFIFITPRILNMKDAGLSE